MRDVQSTVLYRWFNDVWNNDDENAIEKLMNPDTYAHGIFKNGEPIGAEGFKKFFREFRSQFQDIHIDVDDVVVQDDMESARNTIRAMHIPTGRPVTFGGICMVRIENGKIAEAWNHYDFLDMYQQIGQILIPAEALAD
ncbi:MAG TPA: ester cyclase [Flavisolibacter sp.]|nr:ester cyclase [Flavisolibacter sp.]